MIPTAFALLLTLTLQPDASPVPASPLPVPAASDQATATPAATETPIAATPSAGTTPPSPAAGATSPASPGASPSPVPGPTVDYGFRFVPHQPEHPAAGAPIIFAIYLNSNKLKSLGPIDIKVSTAPDVVKVFTHSNGRDSAIPMIAPGDFEALGKLPRLPFIASGITTTIDFVAVGANGKRVTVPVPVHLQ